MSQLMFRGVFVVTCGLFAVSAGQAQNPGLQWETRHCLAGGFRVELPVGSQIQQVLSGFSIKNLDGTSFQVGYRVLAPGKVVRSMREISTRNTRAALGRMADHPRIEAEFTRHRVAVALWHAENDFPPPP